MVSIPAGWRTLKLVRKTDLKLSGQFAECWWFYPGAYSVINVHKGTPGVFMSKHDQFDFTTVADYLYPLKIKYSNINKSWLYALINVLI